MPATQLANSFAYSPRLSAITIAYRNADLIADLVLPRVPVDTPSFAYTVFNKTDSFSLPDTKVGRTSRTNQIDWSSTQEDASVEDHGLEEVVPRRDQQIATAYGSVVDPKAIATEQISDTLALVREYRASGIVFNPASYATGNKTTLSGTNQWSDPTSDPLADFLGAMDGMLVRPNQLVLGQVVWSTVRRHPKLVSAALQNPGTQGAITQQQLADLLEIQDVVVGQAWANTAPKGQAPNRTRLWGADAALLYKAPVTLSTRTATFGITAQWGEKVAFEFFDPNKGLRGSDVVRAGEAVRELVLANDFGYLFQNAVAA